MDLKASAVLLNLWKSSKVRLNKNEYVQLSEAIDIVEILLKVFYLFKLLGLVTSEEGESCCGLEKNQH
jgi:hypothetical protein